MGGKHRATTSANMNHRGRLVRWTHDWTTVHAHPMPAVSTVDHRAHREHGYQAQTAHPAKCDEPTSWASSTARQAAELIEPLAAHAHRAGARRAGDGDLGSRSLGCRRPNLWITSWPKPRLACSNRTDPPPRPLERPTISNSRSWNGWPGTTTDGCTAHVTPLTPAEYELIRYGQQPALTEAGVSTT